MANISLNTGNTAVNEQAVLGKRALIFLANVWLILKSWHFDAYLAQRVKTLRTVIMLLLQGLLLCLGNNPPTVIAPSAVDVIFNVQLSISIRADDSDAGMTTLFCWKSCMFTYILLRYSHTSVCQMYENAVMFCTNTVQDKNIDWKLHADACYLTSCTHDVSNRWRGYGDGFGPERVWRVSVWCVKWCFHVDSQLRPRVCKCSQSDVRRHDNLVLCCP